MDFTFKEAWGNKEKDSRLIGRKRVLGKLNEKDLESSHQSLKDCAEMSETINLDELSVRDNPKHVGRNLPEKSTETPAPFEEIEFEEQTASRYRFRQ